jgi:glycosyl transferase family 25
MLMSVVEILNNYFDKIYVISLERAKDRHAFIKRNLIGLNYEFYWGVDGRNWSYESLIEKGQYDFRKACEIRGNDKGLILSEIGCALSHRGIYEDMLSKGYEKILVLEDDVYLDESSEKELESALYELPDDWELLYFGHQNNNTKIGFSAYLRIYLVYPLLYLFNRERFSPLKFRRRFPRIYSKNLNLSGSHYGTHSYGLKTSGAKKLLDCQSPVIQASDRALSQLCIENKIKSFNLKERVFFQNRKDLKSLIGKRD